MQKIITFLLFITVSSTLYAQGFGSEDCDPALGVIVYANRSTTSVYSDECITLITTCTTHGGPCDETNPYYTECSTTSFSNGGSGCNGNGGNNDNPYTTTSTYEANCENCTITTVHHTNGDPDDVSTSCTPIPGCTQTNTGCGGDVNAVWSTDCNMCIGGNTGISACPPACNNPTFDVNSISISKTATASIALLPSNWGMTYPETVSIEITACLENNVWRAILTSLTGEYSQRVRLLPPSPLTGNVQVQEITGPLGNTTEQNYCEQIKCIKTVGNTYHVQWYMLSAVQAHEDLHLTVFLPSLKIAAPDIETDTEALSVPNTGQTQLQAIAQIKALPAYATHLSYLQQYWDLYAGPASGAQHSGGLSSPTSIAELNATNSRKVQICNHATTMSWVACSTPCN